MRTRNTSNIPTTTKPPKPDISDNESVASFNMHKRKKKRAETLAAAALKAAEEAVEAANALTVARASLQWQNPIPIRFQQEEGCMKKYIRSRGQPMPEDCSVFSINSFEERDVTEDVVALRNDDTRLSREPPLQEEDDILYEEREEAPSDDDHFQNSLDIIESERKIYETKPDEKEEDDTLEEVAEERKELPYINDELQNPSHTTELEPKLYETKPDKKEDDTLEEIGEEREKPLSNDDQLQNSLNTQKPVYELIKTISDEVAPFDEIFTEDETLLKEESQQTDEQEEDKGVLQEEEELINEVVSIITLNDDEIIIDACVSTKDEEGKKSMAILEDESSNIKEDFNKVGTTEEKEDISSIAQETKNEATLLTEQDEEKEVVCIEEPLKTQEEIMTSAIEADVKKIKEITVTDVNEEGILSNQEDKIEIVVIQSETTKEKTVPLNQEEDGVVVENNDTIIISNESTKQEIIASAIEDDVKTITEITVNEEELASYQEDKLETTLTTSETTKEQTPPLNQEEDVAVMENGDTIIISNESTKQEDNSSLKHEEDIVIEHLVLVEKEDDMFIKKKKEDYLIADSDTIIVSDDNENQKQSDEHDNSVATYKTNEEEPQLEEVAIVANKSKKDKITESEVTQKHTQIEEACINKEQEELVEVPDSALVITTVEKEISCINKEEVEETEAADEVTSVLDELSIDTIQVQDDVDNEVVESDTNQIEFTQEETPCLDLKEEPHVVEMIEAVEEDVCINKEQEEVVEVSDSNLAILSAEKEKISINKEEAEEEEAADEVIPVLDELSNDTIQVQENIHNEVVESDTNEMEFTQEETPCLHLKEEPHVEVIIETVEEDVCINKEQKEVVDVSDSNTVILSAEKEKNSISKEEAEEEEAADEVTPVLDELSNGTIQVQDDINNEVVESDTNQMEFTQEKTPCLHLKEEPHVVEMIDTNAECDEATSAQPVVNYEYNTIPIDQTYGYDDVRKFIQDMKERCTAIEENISRKEERAMEETTQSLTKDVEVNEKEVSTQSTIKAGIESIKSSTKIDVEKVLLDQSGAKVDDEEKEISDKNEEKKVLCVNIIKNDSKQEIDKYSTKDDDSQEATDKFINTSMLLFEEQTLTATNYKAHQDEEVQDFIRQITTNFTDVQTPFTSPKNQTLNASSGDEDEEVRDFIKDLVNMFSHDDCDTTEENNKSNDEKYMVVSNEYPNEEYEDNFASKGTHDNDSMDDSMQNDLKEEANRKILLQSSIEDDFVNAIDNSTIEKEIGNNSSHQKEPFLLGESEKEFKGIKEYNLKHEDLLTKYDEQQVNSSGCVMS